jgi:hypothetical protein
LKTDAGKRDPTRGKRRQAMTDEIGPVGSIVAVMRGCWDLPADCNDGELFTYAEILFDRIEAHESKEALYLYLAHVQVDKLEMPRSEAFKEIVDRSVALMKNPTGAVPRE